MTSMPPYGYGNQQPPMSQADEKMWATLTHVLGIFFGFLPSLLAYLILKDRGPFIAAHAKTALNFQLTLLIAWVVGAILAMVFIGFAIIIAAWVLNIVLSVMAAIAANHGQWYTYKLAITFVK